MSIEFTVSVSHHKSDQPQMNRWWDCAYNGKDVEFLVTIGKCPRTTATRFIEVRDWYVSTNRPVPNTWRHARAVWCEKAERAAPRAAKAPPEQTSLRDKAESFITTGLARLPDHAVLELSALVARHLSTNHA